MVVSCTRVSKENENIFIYAFNSKTCISKLYILKFEFLQQIPPYIRAETAECLYYEAQCRIQDPVYGCFGIISELVNQIHNTECELAKIQAQINILKSQLQATQVVDSCESNFDVLSPQFGIEQFQIGGPSSNLTASNQTYFKSNF